MTVDASDFRQALSRFATGITVVTVATETELHGMTASSFASVSIEPPQVLVALDKRSRTRALVTQTGSFAINVLAAHQEDVSRAFASTGPKPFDRLVHQRGENGAPLLDGALAYLECTTSQVIDGGDHDVLIGLVTRCTTNDGAPLIYFDRAYRSLDQG